MILTSGCTVVIKDDTYHPEVIKEAFEQRDDAIKVLADAYNRLLDRIKKLESPKENKK